MKKSTGIKCRRLQKSGMEYLHQTAAASLAVLALAAVLTGCQETPEVEIVKQKKSVGEAETVAADEDLTIAEQVQAPDTYTTSFKDATGLIEVKADANVVVPDAKGFKLKKVVTRDFTQEDFDNVREVLTGNVQLWNRVYKENDPARGYIKSEIEELIIEIEKAKASGVPYKGYGTDEMSFDEALEEYRAMYEAAPETYETELSDGKLAAAADGGEGSAEGDIQPGGISASATIDGEDYWLLVDNQRSDDWKWIQIQMMRMGIIGNYMPVSGQTLTDQLKAKLKASPADIEKQSDEIVTKLGFSEMQRAGGEYFTTSVEAQYGESTVGYGVHYTRVVEGIPITYTSADGSMSEHDEGQADYSPAWPFESLYLIYDDEGLANFYWYDPYTVTDLSDEYVFLMPFSDIEKIFEEMMTAKYASLPEAEWNTKFEISEIRLGYMRIKEKNNSDVGTLVPVWDFFGSKVMTSTRDNENMTEVADGPYDSWFTVNAMDGSVIDRDLGY